MALLKSFIKKVVPFSVIRFTSGFFYGWHGNYFTWAEAEAKCTGYSSDTILEKVLASTLKVKNGTAKYERDSVIFDEIQYSYPVLSSLMWIAMMNNGKLNVLDYGGSLGTSYFQNKKFLDTAPDVKWCIVEQPNFVKTGNEHLSNDRLQFYNSIEDCLVENRVDVLLLSSLLQYMESTYNFLQDILSRRFRFILFDRSIFTEKPDRLTVHKVNPAIYKANYPS